MIRNFKTLLLSMIVFLTANSMAQDLDSLSLADMLGLQTTIATKKSLTARESPGIVSIVTREEIVRSGSRDLMDILTLLVPGIYAGSDIEGAAGIGLRGLWGFDSRMLIMIDGIEMNEEVFGSFLLGNHYPAEMIEKVEVIRGPGSVIYGGFASLGVVNVVTRGVERDGYVAAARYSQMSKTYSHRNLTLSAGSKSGDLGYDFMLSGGEGQRGEGDYFDGAGNTSSLTDRSGLNPQIYKAGLRYKGLQWRGIVDKYHTNHVHHGWNPITGINYRETYDTYATQLQYAWQLSEKLRLTPKYDFKRTEPWKIYDSDPLNTWESSKKSVRHRAGLQADWDIRENFSLLAGLEYSSLVVTPLRENKIETDPRIKNEFRTVYAEGTHTSNLGRIALGGRFEDPKIVNGAFVPRLGWTKVWDRMHGKFMLAQSFRSPTGIQPARVDPDDTLNPEIATNVELEMGYRLSDKSWLVANIFDIKVEDALVYGAGQTGGYDNRGTLGSRGLEAEYRYKSGRFDLNSSIAYYRGIATSVPTMLVPGETGVHRAAATTRINLHGGWKMDENMGLYPSVIYYSERYGLDRNGNIDGFSPTVVANLNFRYQNLFVRGLQVTAGVMNLTDADLPLLQGYDNGIAEMPNNQRAYNLMVSYEAGF